MTAMIKEEVASTFQRYIPSVKADQKLLNYWSNAIVKSDKTMADLYAYMQTNTDYLNYIKLQFIDMFYEHLSATEISNAELFQQLMDTSQGRLLTADDIWDFIAGTPAFESKYSEIIDKLFVSIYESNPTDQEVDTFLQKFKSDRRYNVDALQLDLERLHISSVVHTHEFDTEIGGAYFGGLGGGDMHGLSSAPMHGQDPEAYREEMQLQEDLALVEKYENVFKRNMNVREYIMYIKGLRAHRDDEGFIDEIFHKQILQFNRVKEVMQLYLDKYVTEDQFLGQFLSRINEDGFVENLRREVIDSHEYEQKMSKRLQAIYLNFFGENMTPTETKYLFDRVKALELELVTDQLNEKVAEFRA